MRPYFKFTLPTLEIHPSERELWAATSSQEHPLGKIGSKDFSNASLKLNKVF